MGRYEYLNRRSKIPRFFQRASTETKEPKDLEPIRPDIPKSYSNANLVHPMHRGLNFKHEGSKRYRMNAVYLDEQLIRSKQFKHKSMGSIIKNILWRMH
jgi:hypothetical protein